MGDHMIIEGEAYEFIRKYVFTPGGPIRQIEAFAESIGRRSINVKYVIRVDPAPARVLNMINTMDELKSFVCWISFRSIADKENWKDPAEGALYTEDLNTALLLASCLKYYTGGAWVIKSEDKYYVWTRGYYHYVGP